MKKVKLLIVQLFSLALAGCFSAVTLPQKQLYTLSPNKLNLKKYQRSHKTLLVIPVQASDSVDKEKMAYVKQPYQLSYFSDHAWAAEPADQITGLITNALRQSNYFKAVATSPFTGTTDLKLSTHLYVLQQNFLYNPSQEQLKLSAQLINTTSGKVIAGKVFYYSIKAHSNNPYGGVVAANQAVKLMLQDLTGFVVRQAY